MRTRLVETIERGPKLDRERREARGLAGRRPGSTVSASASRAACAAETPASRWRRIERTRSSSAAE